MKNINNNLSDIDSITSTTYYGDGSNLTGIGSGSSGIPPEFIFVSTKSDFPTPSGGIITLLPDITYYVTDLVDLTGDRLVGGSNTTILGASSENAILTSTGLATGSALFTTEWTTPIRHISIKDVGTGFYISGSNAPVALDWTGVNFVNVPNVGVLDGCDNFIFDKGSFLSAQKFIISGSNGTIAINNSLLRGTGASGSLVEVASNATITRRFRTIYSSLIASGSTKGVTVHPSASIPTEAFILDTVNFSGGGTYLGGLDHTSNNSLFINCTNITNTAVNGQLYMQNNATATVIAGASTFTKVLGTTSNSADNSKYTGTNNRLTCNATISRKYLIQCSLSFTSGNLHICEFGFYDSKLAAVRTPSRTKSTANSGGRAENISFACVVQHAAGDYLEIWCANNTSAQNLTVTDMNFVITEIK